MGDINKGSSSQTNALHQLQHDDDDDGVYGPSMTREQMQEQ